MSMRLRTSSKTKEKFIKQLLHELNEAYQEGSVNLAYVRRVVNQYGIDVKDMTKPSKFVLQRREKQTKKSNPVIPKGAIKIYDHIEAIEAIKGTDSLWPKEAFRHDFKPGSEVYGLQDGSILIINKKGKKLHKLFKYNSKIDGTRNE